MTDIRRVLAENGVRARLIWSVDEIDKNGMNGNYAAGVIEGLAHCISETQELIAEAAEKIRKADKMGELEQNEKPRFDIVSDMAYDYIKFILGYCSNYRPFRPLSENS
jgi:hypothetical protein